MSARDNEADVIANLINTDPDEEYDRLIGTKLGGKYAIEGKLGEGGMGVVLLARHTIIEKHFAVKVLKREVARDPSVVKRFVQEARAASRIGHPNIVDVTDFGTTSDGMTYSVMEFVEGNTLNTVFKKEGPFSQARALHIVHQIAKGVGAAHDKGIVHRDLKPENIFLLKRGNDPDFVKIVDFGIAKVAPLDGQEGERLTRAGTVFGTPEYMAPEQAAGRADIDGRCDIYAIGTILYELLVGHVPHSGSSAVRTLAMQLLDPIPPPRQANPALQISDKFEQALMKALEKKAEDRYARLDEFYAALENAAADQASGSNAFATKAAVSSGPDQKTLKPSDSATMIERRRTPQVRDAPAPHSAGPRQVNTLDTIPTNRWRVYFLAAAGFVVIAGVLLFVLYGGSTDPRVDQKAETTAIQDAAIAMQMIDAAPERSDSGTPATKQAGTTTTSTGNNRRPSNIRRPSKPPKVDPPKVDPPKVDPPKVDPPKVDPPKVDRLTVLVVTKPNNASLYVNGGYRGTGESRFTRPKGTQITVKCTLPGYKPGYTKLKFDGEREVYMCKMTRKKKCVKGLMNPFDDCPDE